MEPETPFNPATDLPFDPASHPSRSKLRDAINYLWEQHRLTSDETLPQLPADAGEAVGETEDTQVVVHGAKMWRNKYQIDGAKSDSFVLDPDGIMQSYAIFEAWKTQNPEVPHNVQ